MILVSSGQSIFDICLQELGDVGAVFDLAAANGLAITDPLTPGQQLTLPASLLARADVAAYFASQQQRINTGDTAASSFTPPPSPMRDFSPLDYSSNDFN